MMTMPDRRRSLMTGLQDFGEDFDEGTAHSVHSAAASGSASASSRRSGTGSSASVTSTGQEDSRSSWDGASESSVQSDASDSVIGMGYMDDEELMQELEFALQESSAIREQAIPSSSEARRRARSREHARHRPASSHRALDDRAHSRGARNGGALNGSALNGGALNGGALNGYGRSRTADRDRRHRSSASSFSESTDI
mmetsp:Transcript_2811/g.4958  ORF Transcript_2811/g.4958 Transcript_2811/m.4958 type:complete len:198 (-) Transcript_2811:30-623(-)